MLKTVDIDLELIESIIRVIGAAFNHEDDAFGIMNNEATDVLSELEVIRDSMK